MIAYAVAAAGGDAHVVTDHIPSFVDDLDPLSPEGVTFHQTKDFVEGLPQGPFDWVIVVPTGIFLPDFYEACLDFASASGARVGLVNFETGNWFNALAPEPRDPRLWDYWRRLVIPGGLVLSSARESDAWARNFYAAPEGKLRFEVWSPPINSAAAQRFGGLEKDGSLLAFVRPQDAHKGSRLLAELSPKFYAGRTLRLVSGKEVPEDFQRKIERQLSKAKNAKLEILLRISDVHKFRLLTSAQAVLFPTRFEGFGYPPVEAAYSGTESVCFDLPVLRETVGKVANFAPTQDNKGFQTALEQALARPYRGAELRDAVFKFADFHEAAWQLADILLRSADRIAPLGPRAFRVGMGPLQKTPPLPSALVDRHAPVPQFPPYVQSAFATTGDEVVLTVRAMVPVACSRVEAVVGSAVLPIVETSSPSTGVHFREAAFHVLAPKVVIGHLIRIRLLDHDELLDTIEIRVDRVADRNTLRPAKAGISENVLVDDQRKLRGWILAREVVSSVQYSPNGSDWYSLPVETERRDVLANNPGYGVARCEFSQIIPTVADPDPQKALLVCLAGPRGRERAVDVLVGWSPAPKALFGALKSLGGDSGPAPAQQHPVSLAAPSTPTVRRRRPQIAKATLINFSDQNWVNGIWRKVSRDRPAALLIKKSDALSKIKPGSVVELPDGQARRVRSLEVKEKDAEIVLDAPLRLMLQAAGSDTLILDGKWDPQQSSRFKLHDWSDNRWLRSIWNVKDARYRRGFNIKQDVAKRLGIAPGARLLFAGSGVRSVVEIADDNANNRRVWLDDQIKPIVDGPPRDILVLNAANEQSVGIPFVLSRRRSGWVGGIQVDDLRTAGQKIVLSDIARQYVRPGTLLRFAQERTLRVLQTFDAEDGLEVRLDGTLDPRIHGYPSQVFLAAEADEPEGVLAPYLFADDGLPANDPLYLTLANSARRRGWALRTVKPRSERPRVLFLSMVSPSPANQGNRVVTRNLIRHIVNCGYQCDVVVQNWVDSAIATSDLGPDVRLITVPYPRWQETNSAKTRQKLREFSADLSNEHFDSILRAQINSSAENYHPYFIVRDQTVDIARYLYSVHEYSSVVCNYTHMGRIIEELSYIRPLPPVAIITHDALSRLPREFNGRRLDLGHRPCPPEIERDVLDACPGAVVVAISQSEVAYFNAIGVQNDIVLTEFDAAEEMDRYRVPSGAFDRREIIIAASANPMNIAGLDWFVDECWSQILAIVPQAKLVVCGQASKAWTSNLENIELVGELSREQLLERCSRASMTINPCVAGTGLKIKTVETACLGLPAVVLPSAVDGLEEIADQFTIVAQDGPEFVAGCIALLTDRTRWSTLHDGALRTAETRFSSSAVYHELDKAMGWSAHEAKALPASAMTGKVEADPKAVHPGAGADVETEVLAEIKSAAEAAELFGLGEQLIEAGQAEAGWRLADQIANAHRTDWWIAARAAALALKVEQPWAAIDYASIVIGSQPDLAEGYTIMGRAFLAGKLPHDAVAVLEQAALVAPLHPGVSTLLRDALLAAGRETEANKWQTKLLPGFNKYVPLDYRYPPHLVTGFQQAEDGVLHLSSGANRLRVLLPEGASGMISISLDISCPGSLASDIGLAVKFEGTTTACALQARGPQVQSLTAKTHIDSIRHNGIATVELRLDSPVGGVAGGRAQVMGFLLQDG